MQSEHVIGEWQGIEELSEFLKDCLVDRVESMDNIEAIKKVCEGVLIGSSIKYLGGNQILIHAGDKELAKRIVENKLHGLHYWIKSLRIWSEGYRVAERRVWLKITGC